MRAHTNTRNRVRRPTRSRASLLPIYHEGAGAFMCGAAEADCPYNDQQQHAAWRMGWSDIEARSNSAPLVFLGPDGSWVKHRYTDLWQAIQRYWTLLPYGDQEQLMAWTIEHRNLPTV